MKRIVSLILASTGVLSSLCSCSTDKFEHTDDSFTRTLEVRTDMVHDNPGAAPYVTQYDDVEFLAERGLTGKVFFLSESAHLAIDWQAYDQNIFPNGSDGYKWVQNKKEEYRQKYKEAKDAGLKVYFMMDFISLPNSMKELYGSEILTGEKIDINKPKTKEIMAEMIKEIFNEFPELDGIYPRYGESYVGFYSGYHFGNNPIAVSSNKADDHVTLLKFFRDEVCEKYGKEVVYRTWSTETGADSFTTSADLYLEITNQVEPHENLFIAIKHTAGDFWRNYTFNETIGIGKHQQIVEIQCAREYEGKGSYPNYIAGSVINGFKEYSWQMSDASSKCLRDVVNCENSTVAGIWTWSRGGGWGGPYPNGTENRKGDELWCDLNAYVLHTWAQDTSRTDKSIVKEYAKSVLGMNNTDADNFYKLVSLSSDAVLYGIGTNSAPALDPLWTRDASVDKNRFNSNVSVIKKYPEKLEERHKAVELWSEITEISNSFDDSVEKKEFIILSAKYGYYLFSIFDTMYTAGVTDDATERANACNEFDILWAEYEKLSKDNPAFPSLYDKDGFNAIIDQYRS